MDFVNGIRTRMHLSSSDGFSPHAPEKNFFVHTGEPSAPHERGTVPKKPLEEGWPAPQGASQSLMRPESRKAKDLSSELASKKVLQGKTRHFPVLPLRHIKEVPALAHRFPKQRFLSKKNKNFSLLFIVGEGLLHDHVGPLRFRDLSSPSAT
jgi:hypothetical protein